MRGVAGLAAKFTVSLARRTLLHGVSKWLVYVKYDSTNFDDFVAYILLLLSPSWIKLTKVQHGLKVMFFHGSP
jgi:hypothetical protein